MASDSNEQGAGDLWELTIDDLFSSSEAAASDLHAAVPGPYAIDLCTSVEPATELAPSLQAFEHLHAYQVTDWKDNRLVFRLRLGPIDSELEADAILSIVCSDYPDAITVPVGEDDLRMIALVASSSPARSPKPQAGRAEAVGKGASAEAAEKAKPATTAVKVAKPKAEPAGEQPERAASPVAAPGSGQPQEPANLFRDLAAELLAFDAPPSGRGGAQAAAFASVSPPVLTAAVQGGRAPRDLGRERDDVSPGPPTSASPPVLKIDSVAIPPRERADRRTSSAAARASPSGAAQAPRPAAARAVDPSDLPQPPAPPAPPARNAISPDVAPAPVPAVHQSAGAATLVPPRVALSRAPATAAPVASGDTKSESPRPDRAVPATTAAAPVTAGTPDAPSPTKAASVAKPPELPRVALPRAAPPAASRGPSPTNATDHSYGPRTLQATAAPATPATDAPSFGADPRPAPGTHEPPRVALRGEPTPGKTPARHAEATAASRQRSEPATPPPEPHRVAAPASRPAAAAPEPELTAAPTFDLKLLPDEFAWSPDTAAPAPAASAPVPSATPSEPERIATSPMALELAPDPPPRPAAVPEVDSPAPPIAPAAMFAKSAPAAPAEPAPERAAVPPAPGPKSEGPPAHDVKPSAARPSHPPAAPPTTAPRTRVTTAATSTTPSTPIPDVKSPAARTDAPVPKPVPPQRTQAAPASTPKPAAPAARPQAPAKPAAPSTATPPAAAAARTPTPPATTNASAPPGPPPIDRTQTLRALVVPDAPDQDSEKLLVIQLLVSEQEIQPESVPNLAIFNEFRLYAAVGYEQGKVMHALRLGFFTDDAPAQAVAGYLRSYFEAPVVTRVSAEERERFGKRRVSARKDNGDTGLHATIELSSAPSAPTTSLADLSARSRTPAASKSGHERKRG